MRMLYGCICMSVWREETSASADLHEQRVNGLESRTTRVHESSRSYRRAPARISPELADSRRWISSSIVLLLRLTTCRSNREHLRMPNESPRSPSTSDFRQPSIDETKKNCGAKPLDNSCEFSETGQYFYELIFFLCCHFSVIKS